MSPADNPFFTHLEAFSDRVGSPTLHVGFMESRMAGLLRQAREDDLSIKGTDLEPMPAMDIAFIITSPMDGATYTISDSVRGTGREKQLVSSFNIYLRWLFVSCFEGFEKYLKDMVLEYAKLDATIANKRTLDKDPKLKRTGASKLLDLLRNAISDLEQHETVNLRKVDYRLWCTLFELLRHCIVHADGRAKIDEFMSLVAKKHARHKGGKTCLDKLQETRVRSFFSIRKAEPYSIVSLARSSGNRLTMWNWNWFVRTLIEHAVIIFQVCSKKAGMPTS